MLQIFVFANTSPEIYLYLYSPKDVIQNMFVFVFGPENDNENDTWQPQMVTGHSSNCYSAFKTPPC